jgi:ribosomal protein S12 methylthiotransferase accessory factor
MTVALAAPARSGSKGWFRGTHRACPPEETWARLAPLLRAAGITRVGDVTRLDSVGIPVFQAVRPASHSLTVTLGAGLSPVLARVGAAMAALELWHAERIAAPPNWSSLGAVRANLGYNPYELPLRAQNMLNDGMVLDWVPAQALQTGRPTMVPRQCAEYERRLREEWSPPVFAQSADGLACGNTLAEAVLHALYEVVARDAVARARALPDAELVELDLDTLDPQASDARRLLDRLVAAGVTVTILDLSGPTGIPTIEVVADAPDQSTEARGAAAHLDREVALCRALATAARERLALITGVRDDLPVLGLETPPARPAAVAASAPKVAPRPRRAFAELPTMSTASFAGDVAEVGDRVRRAGAGPVLVVDLTREEIGLPVARVVVPGLRHRDEA